MAVASASSLVLPINPKSPFAATPRLASVSFFSLSQKLHAAPISISQPLSKSAAFVPKVALSSEYEQDEGVFEEDAPPNFSPDLKLFVGNLPFSVDSAQLAQLFESVGNVELVEVIYDKETGRSRGFGFVTMTSVEEVEAAMQQLNGYEMEGRQLRVNSGPPPAKTRRDDAPFRGGRSGGGSFGGSSNRVYVGNLSWGVDDSALQNLFSEQGTVVEARVVYDRETGRSRGFGFVTYSSSEEVNNAIESLDGVDLDGRPIRVSVAESKPPRRQF